MIRKYDSDGLKSSVWGLLVYGFVVAVVIMLPNVKLYDINTDWYMPARLDLMQRAIDDFGVFISLPTSDPFCSYCVLSFVCHLLGITHAEVAFFYVQWCSFFLLIMFFPLVFYWLFDKNLIVAFASVVLLALFGENILWLYFISQYWAFGWVVVIGFPLVMIILKATNQKSKRNLMVVTALVCGYANMNRALSALPVFIPLLYCVVMYFVGNIRDKFYKNVKNIGIDMLFVVCFVVCYVSFTKLIPWFIVFVYRLVNGMDFSSAVPVFSPYHSLYIGLGWEQNPWGIFYKDICGAECAERINPDAVYMTKEYFEILKNEYWRLFAENPIFFLVSYLKKFFVSIFYGIMGLFLRFQNKLEPILMVVACFFYGMLHFGGKEFLKDLRNRWMCSFGVLFVVGIILSLLQCLVAVPCFSYATGTSALFLFGIIYVVSCVFDFFVREKKLNTLTCKKSL